MALSSVQWHEWGAIADRRALTYNPITKDSILFVHHTETPTPRTREEAFKAVRAIERYHVLNNGWVAVGYSYLVWEDVVFLGRGFSRVPAAQAGHNTGNAAVAVIGSYGAQGANWATRKSVINVARAFNGRYLAGHRDVNATDCPGNALYAQLPRIRFWAGKRKP